MKKVGILIVLSIFFIANAWALSTDMKASYQPKETMIVKIVGSILQPIGPANIELKRGHVTVPFEYDVEKIGDDYYIWGIAPEGINNYTLWIKGITTYVSGQVKTIDYSQDFKVEGALIDYYIKPGAIVAASDFDINAYSNLDDKTDIGIGFPTARSVTIWPGQNKISFSIAGVSGSQAISFAVGKYNVAAYIIGAAQNVTNQTAGNVTGGNVTANVTIVNVTAGNVTEENVTANVTIVNVTATNYSLYFIPSKIRRVMLAMDITAFPITIVNNGTEDMKNISLVYDRVLFSVAGEVPEILEAGNEFEINLSVKKIVPEIREDLIVRAGEQRFHLPIEINFTANRSAVSDAGKNITQAGAVYYCIELENGKKCGAGEVCSDSKKIVIARDGSCCLAECKKAEAEGGIGSWVGYVVALLVIAGVAFVWYRYKSVHKEEKPLEKRVAEIERKGP